ncbi:hypothetical protein D9619_007849 [Psilocybe cf. subviscida]|uniref:Uncharacterized protein n=1 Tax=Psilocybe cf. subviscida TaxID=2480587 RepID=A0A8H5AT62_9AGAR|nr:hypothetical protein D9619_007849 [Psilocybe cf. subviscida]
MPLFGHKNKNHTDTTTTTGHHTGGLGTTGGGRHDQMNSAGMGTTGMGTTTTGMSTYPRDETVGSRYPQTGSGGGALANDPTYGGATGTHNTMPGQHFASQADPMTTTTNDPYVANNDHFGAQGLGGGGGRHNNTAGVPPTGFVNHDANGNHGTGGSGAGTRMTGKVESAIGTMIGSSALKAKGLQKEQEANAVKMQSRELQEAERLEHEALLRRERAVGHGAHPANGQLGGGGIN